MTATPTTTTTTLRATMAVLVTVLSASVAVHAPDCMPRPLARTATEAGRRGAGRVSKFNLSTTTLPTTEVPS